MLGASGVPSTLVYAEEPMIIIGEVGAEINNLCAGDIEIALLLAIILATVDRSWKRRIIGAAAGLLLITIVNPVRIFVVLYAGHAAGWGIADITHDILFRAMLILIIVVYYFLWYVKYDWFSDKLSKLWRDKNAVDGKTRKRQEKAKKT
jgi:exosortase/archaeosortase family protein